MKDLINPETYKRAVCTADEALMKQLGFPENAAKELCLSVKKFAEKEGILDLEEYYFKNRNIINDMIRKEHPVYLCSRRYVHPIRLLDSLGRGGNDITRIVLENSLKKKGEMKKTRRTILADKEHRRIIEHLESEAGNVFHI